MKIVSWNVNGIRSLKKSVDCVLNELSIDIACFQETKVSRNQLSETTALIDGYTSYFSYPRKQGGYSGVAIYCKDRFVPEDAEEDFSGLLGCGKTSTADLLPNFDQPLSNSSEFDSEGRVVITYHLIKTEEEILRLAIINVYCPRVDPEKPERHMYKMQFCFLLEAKLRELCEQGCSVIIVGDFNIAHSVIDHCDPGNENEFNSSEARQWLKALLSSKINLCGEEIGIVDAFRHFYPDRKEAYTCWNTKTGARLTNYGTRIDYILLSSNLIPLLENCEILSDYYGSDHCPVSAMLKCTPVIHENAPLPSICTRLWPEFTGQQQKLQTFFKKAPGISNNVTTYEEANTEPSFNKSKPLIKKSKQKSIMNFFKTPASNSRVTSFSLQEQPECASPESNFVNSHVGSPVLAGDKNRNAGNENGPISFSQHSSQSAVAWKSVLSGPPRPPLCDGHRKECVLRTVRKKGPNCGRQFFMCAQPAGHSSNPNASCNFFKWAFTPKVNKLTK